MEHDSVAATPPRKSPLLISRTFALLWFGQSVSIIGDIALTTTLVLWLATVVGKGQPWAPVAVSGLLLAAAIPIFVAGPLAGVFADRWNKRRTMLAMDVARAALIALLIPATLFSFGGGNPPVARLGAIYALVALASICSQFFTPSELALVGSIVEQRSMARASGLTRVTQSIAAIAAPPLAALLVFTGGVQWALVLDVLSFVVSFLCILAMRVLVPIRGASEHEGQKRSVLGELAEGIRFYAGNRVLMTLLIAGVLVLLGAGTLDTLDVFFLTQNLHASASLYGILTGSMGVGLIVGSALAGIFAQRIGVARSFAGSLIVLGLVVLALARMTSFAPGLALTAGVGALTGVANVAIVPLLFSATPQHLLGRVSAVFNPVTSVASTLSIALAGYLDGVVLRGFHASWQGIHVGPIDTIYMGTGVLIALGGLYAAINLRTVTLAPETPEAATADI